MPRYKDVCETLKFEIRTGKFGAGGFLPSERALMRRFAVARQTVRHAIEELRRHNLVETRQGRMSVLAFRAKERAGGTFGLIVPDACYPFYSRIVSGIERCAKNAREGAFSLLSANIGSCERSEQAMLALDFAGICVREKVCGVFFQPLQLISGCERANNAILSLFDKANIPVVLVDSDIEMPPKRSDYDLVGVNNIGIGFELARHVIGRGAQRIVYFSNPYAAPTSLLRGYGVSLGATESGLQWRDDNVFFADPSDEAAVRRLFAGRRRPDAIIAVNDFVAALLLKTLRKVGVRVPDDVLLAGVNGDALAEECDPPLTTMKQPCERIGEAAVHLMMHRIVDPGMPPRQVLFSAEICERASTSRRRRRK